MAMRQSHSPNGQTERSVWSTIGMLLLITESAQDAYHQDRMDLHDGLKRVITRTDGNVPAVDIRVSSRVVSVDPSAGSVKLENGSTLEGFDMVIGAVSCYLAVLTVVLTMPNRTACEQLQVSLKAKSANELHQPQ